MKTPTKAILLNMCVQLMEGLQFIHNNGITHKDLAARNCVYVHVLFSLYIIKVLMLKVYLLYMSAHICNNFISHFSSGKLYSDMMRETLIKDCIILKLYCKFNSLYMCIPYENLYILKSIYILWHLLLRQKIFIQVYQ